MKKTFAKTVTLIMLAASLGACANMTQTQRNTAAGAVLGGVAGILTSLSPIFQLLVVKLLESGS